MTKESFEFELFNSPRLIEKEIKNADKKGESLAYFRMIGEFFYDNVYYKLDAFVKKVELLHLRGDQRKKIWIEFLYSASNGQQQLNEIEFDFDKLTGVKFSSKKNALLSELNSQQLAYEKVRRNEKLDEIAKGKLSTKGRQQIVDTSTQPIGQTKH